MEQQLKQQARQVWYIRLMISLYLASTTAYLAYTMGGNLAPVMRILLTVVSVVVIDAFNGRLMDASLLGFGKSAKSVQYRQALGVGAFIILTLLAHARFFATTTATYLSRTPMAAAIVGEVQGAAEITAIETAQSERAARTAKLEKEKNRIANSEAMRIREARRQGKKLVEAAINSQGENVAALYKSGNAWVMSDRKFRAYRDGIRKAKEEAARLEAEARMETKAASEAFIASTAQDTAYLSTLNRILENKVARNEQLTSVYNFTLGFLDIAFGVLYWFLSLFLAQFKRKHDIEYESPFAGVFAKVGDRIGDDVLQGTEKGIMGAYWLISSPFTAGLKFLRFIGGGIRYRVIGWVESWANIDLDGNGNIGNKSVNPKVENTDLTTQKVGRMPIGFSVNKAEQKVGETPPTSTDLGTARFTDVGVTPTSPTFTPTFEIVGAAKQAEKVGEKSVELPPTSPDESTDLRPRKTPTIARKSADKAARNADIKKLVDALRTAWKKRYSTYPDLLRQAQERGVTVHINEEIISITKPKPTPKRKK
jgi:hypothetical protein